MLHPATPLTALLLPLLCVALCLPQAGAPAFEVASVKPVDAPTLQAIRAGRVGVKIDAARAEFGNQSLLSLIAHAYRLQHFQISGPDWLSGVWFDIAAKLPEGSSMEQVPEMLQALLVERFHLASHREAKESSIDVLLVAGDGSKLTPKPADYDPATSKELQAMSMQDCVTFLTAFGGGQPLVDLTGLKGEYLMPYNEAMKVVLDYIVAMRERARDAAASGEGATDPVGPLRANMAKKLGLRVEHRKLPIPFLVIDHIEKTSTAN